ncbi:MAG: maleylpyruvate isomerase family mycothiol-dependent enzyme [Actinomycetota bacterium]|nr:maleylpyruvate isomerase family mycothiol-dependent enzyme [Actinomycetota bacterium]
MSDLSRILDNYDAVWPSIDRLLDELTEDDWSVQSLCPDWTVKGVLAHLAAVERGLTGWLPSSADDPLPFGAIAAYLEQARAWTGAELAADYRRLIAARRAEISALTDADFARPSPTPVGPATYGRFMDIRAFDFWVHERDMRLPLGRPAASETGLAAERSIEEVVMSMGYIAGKKIGLPDGKSMAIHLTGPVVRDVFVRVEGRAQVVAELDAPDVTVSADSTTFVMLACGRIDPEAEVAAGRISWTGDGEIGARAVRNLSFTM